MRDFLKNKVVTTLVVIGTVILAGVAIFTAIRLYQLRTRPVAPTAPESVPVAAEPTPAPEACQQLAFALDIPSPTPTDVTPTPTSVTPTPTSVTPTATAQPTPTATTTPPIGGQPSPTPTATSTPAPTSTTTPVPTQIAAPTPSPTPPTLPQAGVGIPTILFLSVSFLLIILSFAIII